MVFIHSSYYFLLFHSRRCRSSNHTKHWPNLFKRRSVRSQHFPYQFTHTLSQPILYHYIAPMIYFVTVQIRFTLVTHLYFTKYIYAYLHELWPMCRQSPSAPVSQNKNGKGKKKKEKETQNKTTENGQQKTRMCRRAPLCDWTLALLPRPVTRSQTSNASPDVTFLIVHFRRINVRTSSLV